MRTQGIKTTLFLVLIITFSIIGLSTTIAYFTFPLTEEGKKEEPKNSPRQSQQSFTKKRLYGWKEVTDM